MGYAALRYVQTISNRTNNCGGNKKAGLAPTKNISTPFAINAIRNRGANNQPQSKVSAASGCAPTGTAGSQLSFALPVFNNNPGGQCSGGVGMRLSLLGCRYN